ncbi:MAG: DNA polymerase IV [Puniceicoccaceae bacterium 5H]|nr:MAG: DNA polymerase IV [Puniceicoccaceae bacterium 5H]
MGLRYMFFDFDSYFASCEQQLNEELRGRPVGVVPMLADTTCCIAASYEAKRFGVRTGTKVAEARKLCPEIQFKVADHHEYIKFHEQAKAVIENCLHVEAVMSIDEMYGLLPTHWQSVAEVERLTRQVKAALAATIGESITCSIGAGPNLFLAKVASGMRKPDGLKIIETKDLPRALYELKPIDLYGIGPSMEARLKAHGIHTVEQLCALTQEQMRDVWGGIEGLRYYARLRGEDWEGAETQRRTVGHSHVISPDKRSWSSAKAISHRLLQKAALRLRNMGYYAGRLELKVRVMGQGKYKSDCRLGAVQDTRELTGGLNRLWQEIPHEGYPLKVAVTLTDLTTAESVAGSLFPDLLDDPRRSRIDQAMDSLNQKFGSRTVFLGSALGGMSEAPLRIAFSRIPDLKTERD